MFSHAFFLGDALLQQIAPRQGPMRVREFTLAEIEHFVNPDDKSHPKFKDVADLEFNLFPRAEQSALQDHVKMRIGDAVSKVNLRPLCFSNFQRFLLCMVIAVV